MTDPLADSSDVEKILQRSLTAEESDSCDDLLEAASAMFRDAANQDFTPGSSTVRLKVNGERVRLDQRPCTAVQSVVDDNGNDVSFTRNGCWLTVDADSSRFLTISYEHGGDVPVAVRLAVAEMVSRALTVPGDVLAGARSTSDGAGPYSQSTSWGNGENSSLLRLSDSNLGLAQSYLWPGGQVIVQRP